MQTKHTPGPWEYSRMILSDKARDRRCGFIVNGPEPQESLPVRVCDLRVSAGLDGFGQAEANARLIAAAPDLLALVLDALDDPDVDILGSAWVRDARTAIAKATGSQP